MGVATSEGNSCSPLSHGLAGELKGGFVGEASEWMIECKCTFL